jgi:hypothetical protein
MFKTAGAMFTSAGAMFTSVNSISTSFSTLFMRAETISAPGFPVRKSGKNLSRPFAFFAALPG